MAIQSRTEAVDAIFSRFLTVWDAEPSALRVLWQDDDGQDPPSDEGFARASIRHDSRQQGALGAGSTKRYTNTGLVTIQIFTLAGNGRVLSDQLADTAVSAFEGQTAGDGTIWFRNTVASEVGISGQYLQVNVTSEFEYDVCVTT